MPTFRWRDFGQKETQETRMFLFDGAMRPEINELEQDGAAYDAACSVE